jgi:hypothetical protein
VRRGPKRERPAPTNRRRLQRAAAGGCVKIGHLDLEAATRRAARSVAADGKPRAIYVCRRCARFHVTREISDRGNVVRVLELDGGG